MDPGSHDGTDEVALAELRRNWQLPATWHILHVLARPLSMSAPAPAQLELAVLRPAEHSTLVANLHGRLLGLSTGKTSEAKWISACSKIARSFPDVFSPILGVGHADSESHKANDEEGSDTGEPSSAGDASLPDKEAVRGMDVDDNETPLPRTFASVEEYRELTPIVRLLFLHAVAELVICEHDSLLRVGNFAELGVDELRVEPLGVDAVGNTYWYFDDESRLYREPSERASRSRSRSQAENNDTKSVAPMASEDARGAQTNERSAGRTLKKRQKNKRSDLPAPTRRSTRVSNARERGPTPGSPTDAGQRPRRSTRKNIAAGGDRHSSSSEAASDGSEEQNSDGSDEMDDDSYAGGRSRAGSSGLRRSTRTRRSLDDSVASIMPARRSKRSRDTRGSEKLRSEETPAPRKKQRTQPRSFDDPSLRECAQWELLAAGASELSKLLDRFGEVKQISHPFERALVRALRDHVLPVFEEADNRRRKEEEKKARAEWLASNIKKSSRVSAREQRRERELEEARARAAEEAALERRRSERKARFEAEVKALEREAIRELRIARNAHGHHDSTPLPSAVVAPRASRLRRLRERSDSTTADGYTGGTELPRSGRAVTAQRPAGTASMEGQDTPAETATFGEDEKAVRTSLADHATTPNDGSDAIDPDMGPDEQTEPAVHGQSAIHKPNGARSATSSAIPEADIPSSLTWTIVPEDKMPTRALTKFVVLHRNDMSIANLEELTVGPLNLEDNDLFGYGILVPPEDGDGEVTRIELESIQEWFIEYGSNPIMWLKTKLAWYEMREPLADYAAAFDSTKRKFEICTRLMILGRTMRTQDLGYDDVIHYLGMKYLDMRAYAKAEILEEAPFIVSQVNVVGNAALRKSGFIRNLSKRVHNSAPSAIRPPATATGNGKKVSTEQSDQGSKPQPPRAPGNGSLPAAHTSEQANSKPTTAPRSSSAAPATIPITTDDGPEKDEQKAIVADPVCVHPRQPPRAPAQIARKAAKSEQVPSSKADSPKFTSMPGTPSSATEPCTQHSNVASDAPTSGPKSRPQNGHPPLEGGRTYAEVANHDRSQQTGLASTPPGSRTVPCPKSTERMSDSHTEVHGHDGDRSSTATRGPSEAKPVPPATSALKQANGTCGSMRHENSAQTGGSDLQPTAQAVTGVGEVAVHATGMVLDSEITGAMRRESTQDSDSSTQTHGLSGDKARPPGPRAQGEDAVHNVASIGKPLQPPHSSSHLQNGGPCSGHISVAERHPHSLSTGSGEDAKQASPEVALQDSEETTTGNADRPNKPVAHFLLGSGHHPTVARPGPSTSDENGGLAKCADSRADQSLLSRKPAHPTKETSSSGPRSFSDDAGPLASATKPLEADCAGSAAGDSNTRTETADAT